VIGMRHHGCAAAGGTCLRGGLSLLLAVAMPATTLPAAPPRTAARPVRAIASAAVAAPDRFGAFSYSLPSQVQGDRLVVGQPWTGRSVTLQG